LFVAADLELAPLLYGRQLRARYASLQI
jgi:hypothetical protein